MFFRPKPENPIDQIKEFLQLDNFKLENEIFSSPLLINREKTLHLVKALHIKLKQLESEEALSYKLTLSHSRAVSLADLAHAEHIQRESRLTVDVLRRGHTLYENPENAIANIDSSQRLFKHATGRVFINFSKINQKNLGKLVFVSRQEEHSRINDHNVRNI